MSADIVGQVVQWRHRGPDGNAAKDLRGVVVAVALAPAITFRLLVRTAAGLLETVEAADVEVVTVPYQKPAPTSIPGRRSLLEKKP